MYRTLCVMALVALCAGLAHSFSWEIVMGVGNRLEFRNINGTLTHTENMTIEPSSLSYDPVHNRVLFSDFSTIYSFDICTKKTELLIDTSTETNWVLGSLTYDPATELLFWSQEKKLYSLSLKPESNNRKFNKKPFVLSENFTHNVVIDSCGGFIYGMANGNVYKVRFNGSEKELVIDKTHFVNTFTIDQQSQKMYMSGNKGIQSADLNGKNVRTIHKPTQIIDNSLHSLAVSKDFMFLKDNGCANETFCIWRFPKSSPHGIDVEPKVIFQTDEYMSGVVVKYNIEDITRENQNCDALKSLLPNKSDSTDARLLCAHGTKVSGESQYESTQGYSGERGDVSVCQNYCLHGDCSASAEGQPKCSCNAGYSGERCQVDVCQGYCLNDGVCALSEQSKPLCWCTAHYDGERCELPIFLIKCSQTVSMLRDILNTDVTSDKWLKSSCASTAS